MKINKNTQIPDVAVYAALAAVIFGISIWLLVFHSDSPNNWFLYVAMIVTVAAGVARFVFHLPKRRQPTA
jgi:hypothetical protein